jgi:hypothetical protein
VRLFAFYFALLAVPISVAFTASAHASCDCPPGAHQCAFGGKDQVGKKSFSYKGPNCYWVPTGGSCGSSGGGG